MIRFIRRLRQDMLSSNRLKKYFLYAIGEILLVVVGILLALQLNEWNAQRKLNIESVEYKAKIIEDLKLDTTRMARLIRRSKRIRQGVADYFSYFDEGNHSITALLDSSRRVRYRFFRLNPQDYTLTDMQSSGKTGLLTETERKTLFDLATRKGYLHEILDSRMDEITQYQFERNKYLDFDLSEKNFFEVINRPLSASDLTKGLLQQHNVLREIDQMNEVMINFGSSLYDDSVACIELLANDE